MNFLNPALLWGLLAVTGPLIIHWIHQNRHRTMPWAATLFLEKSRSQSAWWAKIKQWLLLAARTLAVASLALAFCRPITGVWIPSWFEENPECIVLVLDRSSSMEAVIASHGGDGAPSFPTAATKRVHALRLWMQASLHTRTSRWFLWENVLQQPLELASLSGLDSLPLTGPTDTAADIPSLLLGAVRHLESQGVRRSEIWIASDMQSSNWKTDAAEWEILREKSAAWKGTTVVRLLDLSSSRGANVAISFKEIQTRLSTDLNATGRALRLALKIRLARSGAALSPAGEAADAPAPASTLRLLLNLRGAVSAQDAPVAAPVETHVLVPAALPAEPGWGSVQIPADGYGPDNAAYFAWAPPPVLRSLVVGEGASAQLMRLACAPDPASGLAISSVISASELSASMLAETDLVVWMTDPVTPEIAQRLSPWIDAGGVLFQLPPGERARERAPEGPALGAGSASPPPEAGEWGALAWNSAETGTPRFGVALWEETDGPLGKTENGQSLPLQNLEILRRQLPVLKPDDQVLATYEDGRPFFTRQIRQRGSVYTLSTRVEEEWSALADGTVLVPVVQRLLQLAAGQRRPSSLGIAGQWKPGPDEIWVPVEGGEGGAEGGLAGRAREADPRWKAGVYQNGARWIALNRPDAEDDQARVSVSEFGGLLPGVAMRALEEAGMIKADSLQSELWPVFATLLVLMLCLETALCWGAVSERKPRGA